MILSPCWRSCGVPFGLRDATGTLPRRSKTLSRGSQDTPKSLKNANMAPQEAPRGPKTPPSSILDDFSWNFHRLFIDFSIAYSWFFPVIFHRCFNMLGFFWQYSGRILEVFWQYLGIILGIFWVYSESILAIFGDYSGSFLGVFWEKSASIRHRGLT